MVQLFKDHPTVEYIRIKRLLNDHKGVFKKKTPSFANDIILKLHRKYTCYKRNREKVKKTRIRKYIHPERRPSRSSKKGKTVIKLHESFFEEL